MIRYCLVLSCAFACSDSKSPPTESNSAPVAPTTAQSTAKEQPPIGIDPSAKKQRQSLQQRVRTLSAEIAKIPDGWGARLQLSTTYMQQAVVLGSLQPYADAITQLEAAREIENHNVQKIPLALAEAHLALHQNVKAQEMLDAIPEKFRDPDNYLRIQGQLQIAKGDLASARTTFESLSTRATGAVRGHALLGHIADTEDKHRDALHEYSIALRLAVGKQEGLKPWVLVLRGLSYLHRGRFPEAKADFAKAVALSPNSILALEHLAEVQGRLGETAESIESYQKVLVLTRNPEFLDAFAGIEMQRGNKKEAEALIAEAKMSYSAMLKNFPKAAYGHAIDFYLGPGDDPALAVSLAIKDSTLRPNGKSYLALVQAHLANKSHAEAKQALDKALTYSARSADLHWTAAELHRALGDETKAAAEEKMALAINPVQATM